MVGYNCFIIFQYYYLNIKIFKFYGNWNFDIFYFCFLILVSYEFFLFFFEIFEILKGLGAIRAKIGPTSDVDKIFSKMYSQYVLFRNKYS